MNKKQTYYLLIILLSTAIGCSSIPKYKNNNSDLYIMLLLLDSIDKEIRETRLFLLDGALTYKEIMSIWCTKKTKWRNVLTKIKLKKYDQLTLIINELEKELSIPIYVGNRYITPKCNTS